MKKVRLIVSIFILIALVTACSAATDDGEAVLIVGDKGYSKSQLEALGTQDVDYTDKDGETTTFTGVLVNDLLEDAGLNAANLVFVAADGYEAEATMDEIGACTNCIVAFDEDSLRMVMPDMSGKLQVKGVVEIKGN
jgi:hypothetical protein